MRLVPSEGYVYLASPYSHPDPFIREGRYLRTMKEMTEYLQKGVYIYSPIVHCHELAKIADMPKDAKFWENYNHMMLHCAAQLWVLMIPGWKESLGVAAEIVYAASEAHIPLVYIEPKEFLL